jgi:hypothetical protein
LHLFKIRSPKLWGKSSVIFRVNTGLSVKSASAIVRLGSNFRSSLGHSKQYGELHGNQASDSSGPS